MRRVMVLAAFLAAAGCTDELTAPDVAGEWGGPRLHLILQEAGGTLEYDCAHGSMDPGWTVSDGKLLGTGEHVQDHGGPVREDEVLPSRPASYVGVIRGDVMALTVTLTDSAQALGTFELRRGSPGQLHRCL